MPLSLYFLSWFETKTWILSGQNKKNTRNKKINILFICLAAFQKKIRYCTQMWRVLLFSCVFICDRASKKWVNKIYPSILEQIMTKSQLAYFTKITNFYAKNLQNTIQKVSVIYPKTYQTVNVVKFAKTTKLLPWRKDFT